MLVKLLMIAAVALLPLPALIMGGRRVLRRSPGPLDPGDRMSHAVLVLLRALLLLLVLGLTAILLVSLIGAIVKDVAMPSLVYVFFFLDLLLAALVLLTFGRRGPRAPRRRATPAAR